MKKILLLIVLALIGFYAAWPAFSGYQIHNALKADDAAALKSKIDFVSVRRSMRSPVMEQVDARMKVMLKGLGPLAANIKVPSKKIEGIIDAALADTVNPKRLGKIYARGGDLAGALQRSILRQVEKAGGFGALLGGGSGGATGAESASKGGSIGGIKLPGGLGGLLAGGGKTGDLIGQLAGKAGLNPAKLASSLFPKAGKGGNKAAEGGKPSSFGLSNIKKFGFAGPLGLQVGVAKDAKADGPDVTAQMDFTGFDWKLTKLTPNLAAR